MEISNIKTQKMETDKHQMLLKFMDDERKRYEELEEYLVCADIQMIQTKISDFILGYSTWNEIEDIVFDLMKCHADILTLDIVKGCCRVTFMLNDFVFGFYVSPDEYNCLLEIQINKNK